MVDRTVALAKQRGGFGWQALRAALDSSPLIGAGRVEDTWNLLGRALRTVATCAAKTLRISREQVLRDAGVPMDPENGQTPENANTWVIHDTPVRRGRDQGGLCGPQPGGRIGKSL